LLRRLSWHDPRWRRADAEYGYISGRRHTAPSP
jgi:hypothetical protein